ncbi:MAG: cytochrome c-type biogenesis protein CcmH [Magnetococcales bacterium]|nr:cytochrome c-type biogenesis protein CcmH [Magnetococcales bacterium]
MLKCRLEREGRGSVVWMVLTLLALLALPVEAAERVEDPTEARVREISSTLRCAVCQNQPIYESNSDLAKDMVSIIREKIQSGESDEAIRAYFHDRYGDYIYLEPTKSGANLILWIAPFAGLLLGGFGLVVAINRWRRGRIDEGVAATGEESPASPSDRRAERPASARDEAMEARLRKEIESFEES